MKSAWTIKWAPGNHCVIVEYRRDEPDKVIHGSGVWGWDSASGEIVYHALYSDPGLEHIRSQVKQPGVWTGKYTGSLQGQAMEASCELRKESPDQWTFQTTGMAAIGKQELDVRFTRVVLPGGAEATTK
jgi:hypothetical protein